MDIQLVLPVIDGDFPSIADNCCKDADDMPVTDTILLDPTVITADNIIVFADFEYTVQDILPAVPLIQRNIILFQSAMNGLDNKQVPALLDERHHTVAFVCIDELAIFGKLFFKC